MRFSVHGGILLLLVNLVALVVLVSSRNVVPNNHFGVNLSPFSSSSTQWAFLDIFKGASPFFARKTVDGGLHWIWENNAVIDWGDDGYPLSLPSDSHCATAEIGSNGLQYPSGEYVCLFDGDGDLIFEGDAQVISSTGIGLQLNVQAREKITVRITRTNQQNRLRNIRIVPLENQNNYLEQVFHPLFLEKLSPFNVLRFSEWQRENQMGHGVYEERSWSKRVTNSSQTQASQQGVALEHMIDLCNRLDASPWFSLPQISSNDYVHEFALMVRQFLRPNLYIYVEFANRVGLNKGVGEKAKQVFDIFESVFGEQQRWRLIFVASCYNWHFLPHVIEDFGSRLSSVDAIAVEGGFFLDKYNDQNFNFSDFSTLSVDLLLNQTIQSVLDTEVEDNRFWHGSKVLGVEIIAFEGGPKLQASGYGYRFRAHTEKSQGRPVSDELQQLADMEQSLEDMLIEVNRHPMMKEIFMDYLRRWKAIGGKTFIASRLEHFPNRCLEGGNLCGSRGLMEMFNSTLSSPKYDAMVSFIRGENSSLPYTSADIPLPVERSCDSCVWGACNDGICECFAGYSGANCTIRIQNTGNCKSKVGINLSGITDYNPQWVFVDVFKSSRGWVTQEQTSYTWNTYTDVDYDKNGYPKYLKTNQYVASMMNRDLNSHYPAGTYIVLYEGDGTLTFHMVDVKSVRRSVGRIEVDVIPSRDPNNGILLRIERTNPADPIRNIRVIMPGFEKRYKHNPFHPWILTFVRKFSTLRFMDWQSTNYQTDVSWSDRATKTSRTYQTTSGVALEDMILFSNMVGISPWFCVPHMADDGYIRNFALMVKEKLRPDLKIYVEYSNEVWGLLFPGGKYAQQQGLLRNISHDPGTARLCFLSLRTKEIIEIWKDVFGNSLRDRLIFVVSSQSVSAYASRIILDCFDLYKHVDALGISPYFGYSLTRNNDWKDDSTIFTLDELMIERLFQDINVTISFVREQKAMANSRNVSLVTYEAGQHLVNEYSVMQTNLAIEANRDPRMKDIYFHYLKSLSEEGVELLTHYSSIVKPSKYGSWGLMESQDQNPDEAPKYQAMVNYLRLEENCSLSSPSCPFNCSSRGECLLNGECGCYFGYTGEFCENINYIDDIDCDYKCHFGRGECKHVDTMFGYLRIYRCVCNDGYYGYSCGHASCALNCSWSGDCVEKDKCNCFEGHSGKFCEIDCGCNGHGSCDENNQCICDEGYRKSSDGKSCEYDCKCSNEKQTCIAPNECSCIDGCENGYCVNGECICHEGYSGSKCSVPVASVNDNSPMGLNLGSVVYYGTELAFVDAMKQSDYWVSQNRPGIFSSSLTYLWNTREPVDLRDDGYPARLRYGKIVSTLMMRDLELKYPAGRYICTYDGEGDITFEFDAKVIKKRKGRFELQVEPQLVRDNGIFFRILQTNENNPIRNVKVLLPGFENIAERCPFHPEFLESIRRFSVIRFMDWMRTNDFIGNMTFEQRTKPSHFTQSHGGVSLEYLVLLCNMMKFSAWINIPHWASDDYVEKYATFMLHHLRKDVMIYVEHSNEVWNIFFPQGRFAAQMGRERGINSHQYHAQRSIEIFHIFKRVFGSENRHRLQFIIGTQYGNNWVTNQILDWQQIAQKKEVDAIGISPYFSCGGMSQDISIILTQNFDQIIQRCEHYLSEVESQIQNFVTIMSDQYNMSVITYEMGPDLMEHETIYHGFDTPGATERFIALNRDPRMRQIYLKYLRMHQRALTSSSVGKSKNYPLMHFHSCSRPSRYGSWGLLEYTGQNISTAPKYLAVQDFINEKIGEYLQRGCNDSSALNFDPRARLSDNSCIYPSVQIGIVGGKIQFHTVSLEIPQNAVTSPISISLRQVRNPVLRNIPQNSHLVGSVIKFGPQGAVFNTGVRLCISIEDQWQHQDIVSGSENFKVEIYHSINDETWSVVHNSGYSNGRVCGIISRFSSFAPVVSKVESEEKKEDPPDQKSFSPNFTFADSLPVLMVCLFLMCLCNL